MTATVELGDVDFNKLHELETGIFDGVTRLNEPGQWRVEFQLDEVPPEILFEVQSVVVRDESQILYAGMRAVMDSGQGGTFRSISPDGRRGGLEGMDCWCFLTSRVVFPDPASGEPWTVASDTRSGPGGEVIGEFIDWNAGSLALAARRYAGLTVTGTTSGANGFWTGRLGRLSDLVRRIADESGLVVYPTLAGLDDRVPQIRLRTASDLTTDLVVADIADLAEAEERDTPSSGSWVLAAGSGAGASRMFRSADQGGSGFFRVEKVIEAVNASTSNELYQIADAERATQAFNLFVSGQMNEEAAEQLRFLVDYELGDIVTVQLQGNRFPTPITAVQLSVTSERTLEMPVLGPYTPNPLQGMRRDIGGLDDRFDSNIA